MVANGEFIEWAAIGGQRYGTTMAAAAVDKVCELRPVAQRIDLYTIIYLHLHIYTYMQIYLSISIYLSIYLYIYMGTTVAAVCKVRELIHGVWGVGWWTHDGTLPYHPYVYTHTHTHTHTYIYIYLYIHIYIHIYIYLYIYIIFI